MTKANLTRKPLVEAIFEVKWQIASVPGTAISADTSFPILFGRFYDRVKEKYPSVQNLPITQVPAEIAPYQVRHRFRIKENAWPLTQVGPGIMSFNETSNYSWETFRAGTFEALSKLIESYPGTESPKVTSILLRYINAYEFDFKKKPLLPFLRDEMKVNVKLSGNFIDAENLEAPIANKIFLQYPIKGENLSLKINFATGFKDNCDAVLWDIVCGADAPDIKLDDMESMKRLIGKSHDIIEKCFFGLIEGKLLKEFE